MNLSHLRAVTKIVDPIHGHMIFTAFEKEIIDSPYFQRLHQVLQNSTTYVAYPSNRNTRFAHSLGVAKISGDLLMSALGHASQETLENFFEDVAIFFRSQFFKLDANSDDLNNELDLVLEGWRKTIQGRSNFTHQPFLKSFGNVISNNQVFGRHEGDEYSFAGFPVEFLADTLWSVVRACGLAHDIGHLPMSHSFEEALKHIPVLFDIHDDNDNRASRFTDVSTHKISNKDKAKEGAILSRFKSVIESHFSISPELASQYLNKIALHEKRSLYIFNLITEKCEQPESFYRKYREVIFTTAYLVLFASATDKMGKLSKPDTINGGNRTGFLRTLKSIVAGEVDSDRMDYTIRDGLACASTIGDFDLERVVSHAILDKYDDDSYVIGFYDRSLSGIERFFSERYDGYKYLIYHRTSSRSEACLQELIGRLIHYAFLCKQSEITTILSKYGFLYRPEKDDITDIIPITEASVENFDDAVLRTAFFEISREIKKLLDGSGSDDERSLLKPIAKLIDVFLYRKYESVYNPFKYSSLSKYLKEHLGDKYSDRKCSLALKALSNPATKNIYVKKFKAAVHREFDGSLSAIVQFQYPKVYDYERANKYEKVYLIDKDGKRSLLEKHSAYINNLLNYKKTDTNIKIYFLLHEDKYENDILTEINDIMRKELISLFDELTSKEADTNKETVHVS